MDTTDIKFGYDMTVSYKKVTFDVEYYVEYGDPVDPYTNDVLHVTQVLCGGQNMEYLLTVDQWCAIESAAAEEYFNK